MPASIEPEKNRHATFHYCKITVAIRIRAFHEQPVNMESFGNAFHFDLRLRGRSGVGFVLMVRIGNELENSYPRDVLVTIGQLGSNEVNRKYSSICKD